MKKQFKATLLTLAGSASLASLSTNSLAEENPFGFKTLPSGYQQLVAEGRCGEGKCGASMMMESAESPSGSEQADDQAAQQPAHKTKSKEGKCGEAMDKASKAQEGKCGNRE